MRVKFEGLFREIHVKVFKTGKMEIPGVVEQGIFDIVRLMILELIKNFHLLLRKIQRRNVSSECACI